MKEIFTEIKPNRVSGQVADQIKKRILDGRLKPGDKLPSERDLCKQIGVGRLSLREGLRILESLGILETVYGRNSGTFVANIDIETLRIRFSEILRASKVTVDQLTEARLEISLIILRYFVERATEEDIKRLEECVDETERLYKASMDSRESSVYFHQLIAQASHNPVFILLHSSVTELLRGFLAKFQSPPEHTRRIVENQRAILKYLKKKDLENASIAEKAHLLYLEGTLKALIDHSADSAPVTHKLHKTKEVGI